MKTILFLATITLSSTLLASSPRIVEAGLLMDYQIVSDEFDPGLEKGTFQLLGSVYNRTTDSLVDMAIITDQTEVYQVYSEDDGTFAINLPTFVQTIYCYKDGLTEVRLDGYMLKDQHRIEVKFFLRNPDEIIIVTKPVIYLYGNNAEVDISIKPIDNLSFTYPVLNNQWKIRTCTNGFLTDRTNDRSHPYLFWEAESEKLDFIVTEGEMEGFLIKTDTTVQFLEACLDQIGFNAKEKTDFITFWAPEMIKKEYALIQFLIDSDYSSYIADIQIQPEVNSMKRVYLLYKGLDEPNPDLIVYEPLFESWTREGLTLVEWGGSVIKKSNAL